jgi:hypothetical protein
MLAILKRLVRDDRGFIVSSELVLVSTVAVTGLSVGLTSLRDSVSQELSDVAGAIGSLDQSYSTVGMHGCRGDLKNSSFTHGSEFVNVCDAVVVAAADEVEFIQQSNDVDREEVIREESQRLEERREMLDRLQHLESRRDELQLQQQQIEEEAVEAAPASEEPALPTIDHGPLLIQSVETPTVVTESVPTLPSVIYPAEAYPAESFAPQSYSAPVVYDTGRGQGRILGYSRARIGAYSENFPRINDYDWRYVGLPGQPRVVAPGPVYLPASPVSSGENCDCNASGLPIQRW